MTGPRPGRRARRRAATLHQARPRYGRIAVLGVSLTTTAVGMLGGIGLLPSAADDAREASATGGEGAAAEARVERSAAAERLGETTVTSRGPRDPSPAPGPPPGSGSGRRVVFDEGDQQVWLVRDGGEVARTYPVSGSRFDNLDPGTYQVYSRSENAVGIDNSGTMKWFVRFARGETGAAIGFHDIPVDDGQQVQTVAQLGTPTSHGCIRQRTGDAKAMWRFAPLGTTVVVVA